MGERDEWQPIETAPRDTLVLVWGFDDYEMRPVIAVAYNTQGVAPAGNKFSRWDVFGCNTWEEEEFAGKPTHWMPLPAPPTA